MSKDAFDSVLSSFYRDETLDENWREIMVSEEDKERYGSRVNLVTCWNALKKLYWEGVQRDIATAILALAEIEKCHPETLFIENEEEESDLVNDLTKLWTPFRGEQDQSTIKRNVENGVSSILSQSPKKRRARALLQACGFMDVDFAREYRSPSFRSWGQRPQVDITGSAQHTAWKAIQCSVCRHCIRSLHYYCCVEGCLEGPVQRNRFKIVRREEAFTGSETEVDPSEYWSLHEELAKPSVFQVCPACLPMCKHTRDHLRAVRHFCKAGDSKTQEFSRELDAWEDYIKGRSLLALGNITIERLIDYNSKAARHLPGSRGMFPAGDSHNAMMFGPLLIENGMTITPGGAFVSLRTPLTACSNTPEDIEELLAEPSQFKSFKVRGTRDGELEERLCRNVYSISPDRKLYSSEKPIRYRRWLSFRKQILGGLFTGNCSQFARAEDFIIDELIEGAETWSRESSIDNQQSENRYILKGSAREITKSIKEVFGYEIEKFLFCFADRMQKRVKLQYSRMSNNCQDFCNAMIFNNDKWDQCFNKMYPDLPPFEDQGEDETGFRHLMSFAGSVSEPVPEGRETTLMATAVNLYDWFPHHDADIIDHVSSLRFKLDPEDFSPNMDAECHDEYLLKAGVTCLNNTVQRRKCNMVNHLLDCPFDNISILAMHMHRARDLYTVRSDLGKGAYYEPFISVAGSAAWVKNRLEVLHRMLLLNAYLSSISTEFQGLCLHMTATGIRQTWKPQPSSFARTRYDSILVDNKLMANMRSLEGTPGNIEGHIGPLLVMMMASMPFMQSPEIFSSRWKILKQMVKSNLKGKAHESDTMWNNCNCATCTYCLAVLNCQRARVHAETWRETHSDDEKFSKAHPDYTSVATLQWSVNRLGNEHPEVIALIKELAKTPQYSLPG